MGIAETPERMDTHEMKTAKEHFINNIRQLGNAAVLLKKNEDGTLEMVFASKLFADMMECSVEEAALLMNGKGYLKTTHEDDRVFVKRMLRRRMSEEGTKELVIRKITAKGKQIWCNINYSFIDDYDEHYIYCTYFDVTSLKEYEERLRLAYMNMGDNFYHVGEKTLGMLRANLTTDGIEDIQGRDLYGTDSMVYHYSEIMSKRAVNYPIFEERDKFLESFSRDSLLEGYMNGILQVSEILYSRRSLGNYCFVRITANVTRHPLTGDVIAFITEEECNEEKVNDTLLDKILVKQFDMVAYLSEGDYGVIIGDAELIGKGSIFPLTKEGEFRHYLEAQVYPVLVGTDEKKEKLLKALLPETVEHELMTKNPYVVNIPICIDGENYYKRFDFYMVDPVAKFYIVLKSDTTDIQKEQIEFNRHLKEALDEAKQANVAKTAFLSRMSHEIRTPMNAIIGLDSIALKESNLTTAVKDDLQKIGESARYLLSLINDVLDMSRIESGKMTLHNEEFLLKDLLEQVNIIAGGQCRDKGLSYDCSIKGKINESYIGDDMKLKQVLVNILGNAVKFTDKGGSVSLKVQQTAQFENQSVLQFIITDTGIGMDKEYIPKIFDAFSQEDDTNTTSYGGSGLGLAITKNIVNLMDGDITVESKKGEGSTFTVEVTLENTEFDRSLKQDKALEEDTKEPVELAGKYILLAEDMLINAEIMKQVLTMRGLEVDHAENGKKALELFEKSEMDHYAAVLMDVRMPVMDGLATTEAIRALDRVDAKDVPIIALTANALDEDVKRSLQAGMNAHLSKPVEPEVLYKTLEQMIGEREVNYI